MVLWYIIFGQDIISTLCGIACGFYTYLHVFTVVPEKKKKIMHGSRIYFSVVEPKLFVLAPVPTLIKSLGSGASSGLTIAL